MAFTIPNQTDASHFHQAEVDSGDIDILVEGFNGDGVIGTGLAVTTASCALKVNISAGTAIINGLRVVLGSGTCTTHATADACNPRFDLVTLTSGGSVARVAGTAGARPVFPAVPAGSAVLATVYIPAGDTVIAANQITDKRVNVENIAAAGTGDDILMRLGADGDVAIMHKSGTLSADATLTNVIEGSPDHLGTAANSLIVGNTTDDGDMMFVVSDGGASKGLLKLCGANGRTVFHGGDILISGAQKLYFNDVGGEYMSGDGCTLTITGATALTPTVGSTAWAAATHAHAASNSGGTVCANVLAGCTLKSTVVNSSLENVGTLSALQVDFINANASTLTITDSTDTGDLASLAVTTHGATTLTTTDDDAAAAHFTVDADGNITLDSATGIMTIEDGGTEVLRFTESCSGDVTIKLVTNAKDLIFTDNGDAEGFRILDAAAGVNVAGLLTAGSLDIDHVLINGTTIGHTCDTDLMTVGNAALTVKGTVTVGVDGTGHDVKLFGCAAGAYMEWDESANLLEVRGATAAGPGHLKLTTGELTVVANDVLGRIDFQAPLEADCSADARLIGASIAAVAGGTFADALNATDIVFYTGHSETAAEKFRFTSQGEIGIFTSCAPAYGNDGQVLTSTGAGTAVAWEDAGGAVSAVANGCDDRVATFSSSTALNGEATLTYDGEHLTIADGNLIIGTAGHGIDFAAQTAASGTGVTPGNEVLNHYEEGTFVPTLLDDSQSASESQGYDEALGFYTRIGNTVHINFSLTVNSFGTLTTSQSILLGGLPFTSANVTGNRHAMAVGTGYSIAVTSGESMTIYMNPNKALLSINLWDTAAGTTPMTLAELSSNAAIYVSGSYKV